MDIGRCLNDQFTLNIFCASFGNTPPELYEKALSLLQKSCHKILFPNILPKDFSSQAKQKVPSKDWFMGWINCRFFSEIQNVEWMESQIYYKCHAALIFIDMTKENDEQFRQTMAKVARTLFNEGIQCYSLFIWNASDKHLEYFEKEKDYSLVPGNATDENLADFLRMKIQGLIVRTAIHFFQSIEKLINDTNTMALFNAKEEVPKDSSKLKKKKQGRALKICGDLALILGCWQDAEAYYTKAYKHLDLNDDYIWLGKVKEGQMACSYLQYLFGEAEQDSAEKITRKLAREAKERLEAASNFYKKMRTHQALESDIELYFKRLHLFKDLKATSEFNELFRYYQDVARLGLKGEGIYKGMLLMASFFYDMKMYRKSGFYLKLVADQIVTDQYDLNLARDIYLAAFPLFHLPLPDAVFPRSFPKVDFLKAIGENQELGKQIKRVAPRLQVQLIMDVMKLSTNEKPIKAKMLSIILHYFIHDLDTKSQLLMWSSLMKVGNSLSSHLRLDLTLLPKVNKIIPVAEKTKIKVKCVEKDAAGKGEIFIFNPWKGLGGKVEDYNWMEGRFCDVKVHLSNPFPFEIVVEMISLVTEGLQTIDYPVSFVMPGKLQLQELLLKFKPLEAGKLSILGVLVKVSNFVHFHAVNNKGIVMEGENIKDMPKLKVGIKDIPVREKINTLKMYFEDGDDVMEVCPKSAFHLQVIVENQNACRISVQKICLTFVFTDSSVLDQEYCPSEQEIKEYQVMSIVLYRSIFEGEMPEGLYRNKFEPMFRLNLNSVPNVDSLTKVYVKLIYNEVTKPTMQIEEYITKIVRMKKGLSVKKMEVYDSFPQDTVVFNGKRWRHVNIDEKLYLTLEVRKNDPLNDSNEYKIWFKRSDNKEVLGKDVLSNTHHNIRIAMRVSREMVLSFEKNAEWIKKLIIGKWKERDLLGSGYLFLEDVDVTPLIKKIENGHVRIRVETDFLKGEGRVEAVLGQFYTVTMKVNWEKEEEKKFQCFVIVTDESDLQSVLMNKNERSVIWKGKRTGVASVSKDKEFSMDVKVMFREKRQYKIFCFIVDEVDSTVYSFKQEKHIVIA